MAAKFEICTDLKGQCQFRRKARIAIGESCPTKAGVRVGIDAVKRAAAEAGISTDHRSRTAADDAPPCPRCLPDWPGSHRK